MRQTRSKQGWPRGVGRENDQDVKISGFSERRSRSLAFGNSPTTGSNNSSWQTFFRVGHCLVESSTPSWQSAGENFWPKDRASASRRSSSLKEWPQTWRGLSFFLSFVFSCFRAFTHSPPALTVHSRMHLRPQKPTQRKTLRSYG